MYSREPIAMWLIFSSPSDPSGIWARQGLRQLGLAPLEFITPESLAVHCQWEHRLGSAGAFLKIALADGRVITTSGVRGVFNRLYAPSPLALQAAVSSDRDYAQSELLAFYLSWLNCLPGVVINRPLPSGLCGPWLHPSEWMLCASKSGLRTPVYRQSSRDPGSLPPQPMMGRNTTVQNIIAFDGEIFGGSVPAGVAQACNRLAQQTRAEMLGIELSADEHGRWIFAAATPAPDIRCGGMPLLRRMAQVLVSGEPS